MTTDSTLRAGDGRFRPGQSGNPGGAPKGYVKLGTRLQRRLREEPKTAEDIVTGLLQGAAAGDPAALKILFDRSDGPLALKIDGLSEAQMRAWALRVGQELMRALPPEHHQAIAEAIMAACGEDQEREVEAEPGA